MAALNHRRTGLGSIVIPNRSSLRPQRPLILGGPLHAIDDEESAVPLAGSRFSPSFGTAPRIAEPSGSIGEVHPPSGLSGIAFWLIWLSEERVQGDPRGPGGPYRVATA
jgi:hypothetical protein